MTNFHILRLVVITLLTMTHYAYASEAGIADELSIWLSAFTLSENDSRSEEEKIKDDESRNGVLKVLLQSDMSLDQKTTQNEPVGQTRYDKLHAKLSLEQKVIEAKLKAIESTKLEAASLGAFDDIICKIFDAVTELEFYRVETFARFNAGDEQTVTRLQDLLLAEPEERASSKPLQDLVSQLAVQEEQSTGISLLSEQ